MFFRPRNLARTAAVLVATLALSRLAALADTVQLKNGEYIDGIVTARGEHVLTVQIGAIGKLEIPLEQVSRVEKNSRTGTRMRAPIELRDHQLPDLPDATDDGAEQDEIDASDKKEDPASAAKDERAGRTEETEEKPDPKTQAEIDQLVYDLQRERARNRHRAERRLMALGSIVVPSILPLTVSQNEYTRISVLRILSQVAKYNPDVIKALLRSLDDSNAYVRDHAVQTLRRLSDKKFGYNPHARDTVRVTATAKWRSWWDEEEKKEKQAQEKAIEDEVERRLREREATSIEKTIEEALERKLRERLEASKSRRSTSSSGAASGSTQESAGAAAGSTSVSANSAE